jgi:Integrase core domain
MRGSTASVSRIAAKKLTSMTAYTSSGYKAVTALRLGIAALFTSTSMPPSSSHTADPAPPGPRWSARSAVHICHPGESARQSATPRSDAAICARSTNHRASGSQPTGQRGAYPRRATGAPEQILTDNGKVFTGRFNHRPTEVLFEAICREHGIEHLLTQPRSPTTTGKIERFHRSLRAEFLSDRTPFTNLKGAPSKPSMSGSTTTTPTGPTSR